MALPTTITGFTTPGANVPPVLGPFQSSGGNYYIFGTVSSQVNLQCQKATDPTVSFSAVGSDQTVLVANGVRGIAGYQVGDVIHIAASAGNPTTLKYFTFDMSSDAWAVTGETIQSGFNPATSGGVSQFGCSIVVRPSDSQVIVVYNGAQAAVMGSSYSRIVAKRRTGAATWVAADGVTNPTPLDAGGQVDYLNPEALLGASSSVHLGFVTASNVVQRTLTSANALQVVSTGVTYGTSNSVQGVAYDNAGTTKIVTAGGNGQTAITFNSGNTPAMSAGGAFTKAGDNGRPVRIMNDGTDVWALEANALSDGDVWVQKSTDNGATWATAILSLAATVGDVEANLSIDGNIYLRGSDYVIPYVVNDNGTLKYNEYVVRSVATTKAFPPFSAPRRFFTRRFT